MAVSTKLNTRQVPITKEEWQCGCGRWFSPWPYVRPATEIEIKNNYSAFVSGVIYEYLEKCPKCFHDYGSKAQ